MIFFVLGAVVCYSMVVVVVVCLFGFSFSFFSSLYEKLFDKLCNRLNVEHLKMLNIFTLLVLLKT